MELGYEEKDRQEDSNESSMYSISSSNDYTFSYERIHGRLEKIGWY